jgi:16S rRNA processing protein RimM
MIKGMAEEDNVLIGRITGVHGLQGSLKADSYSETLDLYKKGEKLLIHIPGGASEPREKWLTVQSVSPYKKKILLRFDEIVDINTAEKFIGADIFIPRENFPALDEGEYYWVDIIGLSVFREDGTHVGKVVSIFPTGSNDVYVVKHNNTEILLPALETVIIDIDMQNGKMIVRIPEGL